MATLAQVKEWAQAMEEIPAAEMNALIRAVKKHDRRYVTVSPLAPRAWEIGMSTSWWGAAVPDDTWGFEDGAAINRTTYAVLFALIGTTHGVGDGSTTFNKPDSRRRPHIGKGSADTLGDTDAILIADRLKSAPHDHEVSDNTGNADAVIMDHGRTEFNISAGSGSFVVTEESHSTTGHGHPLSHTTDENTGSDLPHIVCNKIIRIL